MFGISDQANLHFWSGNVGESDGTCEPLILLSIVVLQADLELYGLNEFIFLILVFGIL